MRALECQAEAEPAAEDGRDAGRAQHLRLGMRPCSRSACRDLRARGRQHEQDGVGGAQTPPRTPPRWPRAADLRSESLARIDRQGQIILGAGAVPVASVRAANPRSTGRGGEDSAVPRGVEGRRLTSSACVHRARRTLSEAAPARERISGPTDVQRTSSPPSSSAQMPQGPGGPPASCSDPNPRFPPPGGARARGAPRARSPRA